MGNKRIILITVLSIIFLLVSFIIHTKSPKNKPTDNSHPSPSPISTPAPTQQTKQQYFIGQQVLSPNKLNTFYFKSTTDISALNPFSKDACFNGDTIYFIWNERNKWTTREEMLSQKSIELIPFFYNSTKKQESPIYVIGDERAPDGCTRLISWIDNNQILEVIDAGEMADVNEFYAIDLPTDTKTKIGTWTLSYELDGKSEFTNNENRYNEVAGIFAQQYCPEKQNCENIQVYQGTKDKPNQLIDTIITPAKMKPIDFTSDFNLKNFKKRVKIEVDDNQYFIIDLSTKSVTEKNI